MTIPRTAMLTALLMACAATAAPNALPATATIDRCVSQKLIAAACPLIEEVL